MRSAKRYGIVLTTLVTVSIFLLSCQNGNAESTASTQIETAVLQPSPTHTQEPTAVPTATPQPTDTPEPTNTPLPTPTATATPTITPTKSTFTLGEAITVEEGGFTFQPVTDFLVDVQGNQAGVFSADDEIILFMITDSVDTESSFQEMLDNFVTAVSADSGELTPGEAYPYIVDGIEGLAVNVTGKFLGDNMAGKIAIVSPNEARIFLAFGLAVNNRWEEEGSNVFDLVLGSVTFSEEIVVPTDDDTDSVSDFPLPMPSGEPASEWNELPIMPQAIAGTEGDGSYYFTVMATKEEAQTFYIKEMGQREWDILATGEGENGSFLMIFQKGEEVASASIFTLDNGVLYIFLVR